MLKSYSKHISYSVLQTRNNFKLWIQKMAKRYLKSIWLGNGKISLNNNNYI